MFPDIITTEDDLRAVVDHFMQQDAFAFDTEGMGPHRLIPAQTEVVWLSLATHGAAVAIPFGHPNGNKLISKATRKKNKVTKKFEAIPAVFSPPPPQLRPSQVFEILRPLFYSGLRKIGANLPFDIVSIAKYYGGDIIPGPYSDIITDQWLLDENFEARIKSAKTGKYYFAPKKGLKEMTEHYFGVKYDVEDTGKDITKHRFRDVGKYSRLDSLYTWLLDQRFEARMDAELVRDTQKFEEPLNGVVSRMSQTGAPVNRKKFEILQAEFNDKLIQAEGDIYRAAGRRFDIGSVPQKQDVLYAPKSSGGQGLKPIKLTPEGKKKKNAGKKPGISDYSTDADSLEAHADNPVVQALAAHSEVAKLLGYCKKYLGDPEKGKPSIIFNGFVHAQFKPYGTVTGRFSSSEPNVQNIPAHGDNGHRMRDGFEAPENYKLVVADYGQIELRVMAHYIGYGRLYEGFLAGIDAHTATAAAVFGVAPEDVTKDMRQVAKGLNFAIVYGAGPAKVASMAGITLKEAKRFLQRHAAMFPEIYQFIKKVVDRCRSREIPHIRTMSGQFRRLPEITRQGAAAAARRSFGRERYNEEQLDKRVWSIQSRAERQAVNSLVQGSAAFLIKLAMIRADQSFEDDFAAHQYNPADRIRLSFTVHDELGVLCPDHRVEDAKHLLREAMLGEDIQKRIKVPLVSDVNSGQTWAEAK